MNPYESPYMVMSYDMRRLLGYVMVDNKVVQDCVIRNGVPFTHTATPEAQQMQLCRNSPILCL